MVNTNIVTSLAAIIVCLFREWSISWYQRVR